MNIVFYILRPFGHLNVPVNVRNNNLFFSESCIKLAITLLTGSMFTVLFLLKPVYLPALVSSAEQTVYHLKLSAVLS